MTDGDLKKEIIEYGLEIGADKIGVAEVENLKNPPQQPDFDPENYVEGAQSAISICLAIPEGVMDQNESDAYTYGTGFGATYVVMMRMIDEIGYKLVKFIEKKGYFASYVGPNSPFEEGAQVGGLLHSYIVKNIAQMAGIGEEGTANLLLTPEFGPRVLLAAVITDASMEPDVAKLVGKVCTKCMECVEICPTKAISEENYPPYNLNRNRCLWCITGVHRVTGVDEPDVDWVNAKPNAMKLLPEYKKKHVKLVEIADWDEAVGSFPKCFRCMAVCPVGREEKAD